MSPEIVTFTDAVLFCLLVTALLMACGRLLDSSRTADRVLFGGILMLMLANYVRYRFTETLPDAAWTAYAIWPRIYLGFETVVIVYTLLSILFFFRRSDHRAAADRSEAWVVANPEAPAVDVFICTYNEDLVILERTILAAKAIDYPNFAVWVLDDGRRDWLRDYCLSVGVNHVTRSDNKGAKGGNINNGLKVSGEQTNAPFVLILDADFAPQRQILKRIVGQFEDPSIGLIQTPQFYYNADPIQHNLLADDCWVDDQRIFFDVMQPSKDAWGAAFCVGTSCVVRRDALVLIGGMPQETVTEDIHVTYRLLQKGLKTRWLNERLSVGLSAESLSAYITQRCRWCLGTIQVALLRDGPFLGRGYTFMQRLHYLHGLLFWFCRPFVLLLLFAPILYYFLGLPAILMEPAAFFMYALPTVGGMWIFHAWVSNSRSLPLLTEVSQMVSALPITFAIAHALVRPFGRPFKVTAKGEDRSRVQVLYQLAGVFFLVIALTLTGMINGPLLSLNNDLDAFSIVWGSIVMIYAFVSMIVCIELPRHDAGEVRFETRFSSPLVLKDRGARAFSVVEVGTTYAVVVPEAPESHQDIALGDTVLFKPIASIAAAGTVVSRDAATGRIRIALTAAQDIRTGLAFTTSDTVRGLMIAHLFSHTPANIAERAIFKAAMAAVLRRMFGKPHMLVDGE